ncbi:MAG: alpha/beta hydrolase [Hyphomicrobiales bacterium]|nr:MAG: alpha/beta hydrolase [Hyphomicrobiales bacterium]
MNSFLSDGIRLSYIDEGEGDPFLLIHGFASNLHVNWIGTGWVKYLLNAGRRVIAFDNRGHGDSEKFHDPKYYPSNLMSIDAVHLLDHLGIQRADVMGYSMGARISAFMSLQAPDRVKSVIFGGLGGGMLHGVGDPQPIVDALLADNLESVKTKTGRMFRAFAEQTGGDLVALASCMASTRQTISISEISKLTMPALVAVGTRDAIAGSAKELADHIPNGQVLDIPDKDHMTAVGDKTYKQGVSSFLENHE